MRRLLARQYVNTVRMLLGDAAADKAAPPVDRSHNGYDAYGAANLALDDDSVDQYEESADLIAMAVHADKATLAELIPCTPKGSTDGACYEAFIRDFFRVAWRRPLADDEVARFVTMAIEIGGPGGDGFDEFDRGVQYLISAALQSPNFLYQVELGEMDPAIGKRRLTPTELATRLSLFLTDTAPDAALLDDAEAGLLSTPEDIEAKARELIESEGAGEIARNFFAEIYKLRDLPTTPKTIDVFPQFTPAMRAAMLEEAMRLIDDVVWERDTDARELFTTEQTFVNADIAPLYGMAPPSGDEWKKVAMAKDRAGLLGTAGMLARHAHAAETSPTYRGLLVRVNVLCQTIAPPPPGVMTNLSTDPNLTMKEKLAQHMDDETCGACHKLTDTVGLAFERFDAIGAFRTTAQGQAIDTKQHADDLGDFSSPKELGAILFEHPEVPKCLVRNLFRSALGHAETKGELPALQALETDFSTSGFRFKELMVALVANPVFSLVGEPK
jgi:hypothetical protein